ncbi:MAG TPA: spore maturation protein [Bacillota bacterium]|jgi:spore maturation protein B|nr:spore maturation protein [Bacillota bacterium]HOL09780.1 spore maturation protein [Bacillota bacterium]HPO97326.1 spore maturation protein [Bacillota bacterium]
MLSSFIAISKWSIPILLLLILIASYSKKIKVYEVFVQGAMEGLKTTFKLTPYILAIFVVIGLFRTSGALDFLVYLLRPLLKLTNLAPELLTLGLLKPLSGSASLGTTAELFTKYGPDSALGMTASLIQGCSETTFYVLSVYLGAVNIADSRHLLLVGLICEIVVFILALIIGPLLAGF